MEGSTFGTVLGHNTVAAPHASQGGTINISSTTNYHSSSNLDERTNIRPTPCSTVPFVQDADFVDRPEIIARIDETCSKPAGRVALVGLGGVG
jgi:hypothetical protein